MSETSTGERYLGNGYVVTYGAIDRLWHDACEKHHNLPDVSDATIKALVSAHVCGPRPSAWTSAGSS